jgi:hypothetical protein
MGDRANIVVLQPKGDKVAQATNALFAKDRERIYLYSHWGGSDLPLVLQSVLARKARWSDHAYLTRMIFSAMINGDNEGETGYGISTDRPDNEHDYLVVDCDTQSVSRVEEDGGKVVRKWSFEKFIALDIAQAFKSY